MPNNPTPEEAALVQQHFLYLKDLHERGIAKFIGRTLKAPFVGVGVFEAADEAAFQEIVDRDPAVAGGVFTAQAAPFAIVFPVQT